MLSSLAWTIHPVEMLVEAKVTSFSDTPFELAGVIFQEPSTAAAALPRLN